MKKAMMMSLALMFCATIFGCTRIEPGKVGVKVNNLGSERGVQDYTLSTGMVMYMPVVTSVFEYPTFVQTAVWTHDKNEGPPLNEEITFNTKEGTNVSADISLSYQLKADKVPQFYVKFRSDNLNLFTHGFLRNIARDAFNEIGSRYTLEEVYGAKKEELLSKVKSKVNDEVESYGVNVVQFGFIGSLRMDGGIMQALNNKLKAIQDAIATENQLRQAKADAQKKIAAAEGEARANELLAKSITPQLVQWRQLAITEQAVDKWDGARPMVEGQSSGLLLQLPIK